MPSYPRCGLIGAVQWNNNYSFEVIGVYSDMSGTVDAGLDLSKFSCVEQSRQGYQVAMIWYDGTSSTNCLTWRCRIRKLST